VIRPASRPHEVIVLYGRLFSLDILREVVRFVFHTEKVDSTFLSHSWFLVQFILHIIYKTDRQDLVRHVSLNEFLTHLLGILVPDETGRFLVVAHKFLPITVHSNLNAAQDLDAMDSFACRLCSTGGRPCRRSRSEEPWDARQREDHGGPSKPAVPVTTWRHSIFLFWLIWTWTEIFSIGRTL
jgi:hypothetical protein